MDSCHHFMAIILFYKVVVFTNYCNWSVWELYIICPALDGSIKYWRLDLHNFALGRNSLMV